MSKNTHIYSYNKTRKPEDNNAPIELHDFFVANLVSFVMESDFITSIDFGLGGVLISLKINSVKTKYFAPPNVANALGKYFKTLSITMDSYSFEANEKTYFDSDINPNTSHYKNMMHILNVSFIDLNNFENEIRDALMSINSFIKNSSKVIEKHLPLIHYPEMLKFDVSEKNLRLTYLSDIHNFPIERSIEAVVTSRISFSFSVNKTKQEMISVGTQDLLFDDIFRKRYLRDGDWPYLLYSDLEITCKEIKLIFDDIKKNHRKYKQFFN
jgi:hypothetical protein